jgi:hypothetical protein
MKSYLYEAFAQSKAAAVEPAVEAVVPEALAVGVEDLDPGAIKSTHATIIAPNSNNTAEVNQLYRELEVEAESQAQDHLTKTVESLHEIRDLIDEANQSGGLSAESAYFAAFSIESLSTRLGLQPDPLIVSFESAIGNPDGKVTVSTEALAATLEGVDNNVAEIFKRGAAVIYRYITPLWSMIKIAGMGIDGIVVKTRKVKPVAGAKIKISGKRIMEGNAPAPHVADAMVKAGEILKYMIKSFSGNAVRDFNDNLKAAKAIVDANAAGDFELSDMEALWSHWKDPRTKIGQNPSAPIIGNRRFFQDQSLKYKGDNAVAKKFDEFANLSYPSLVGFQDYDADEKVGKVTIDALTPDQIVAIGGALRQAVNDFGWFRAFVERQASQSTMFGGSPIQHFRRRAGLRAALRTGAFGTDEMNTIKDAFETSNRMRFHVGYDAGRVLRQVIHLYRELATKSLKAHLVATTEAIDQATATDGYSVNETSPIEPVQVSGVGDLAPEGPVMPVQTSINDAPESMQDLNGPVKTPEQQVMLAENAAVADFAMEAIDDKTSIIEPTTGVPVPYWYKG